MSHAALVNDGLFWLVLLMTLLPATFVYAVVVAPPKKPAIPPKSPRWDPLDCPRPCRPRLCRPGRPRPPRPPLAPPARPAVPAMRPGTLPRRRP
jgi:hypothetical protein